MKYPKADAKLREYARRYFLHVGLRVPFKEAADFAALLRAGCLQDLKRLIIQCASDIPPGVDAKTALLSLGQGIEGEGYESWGLADCSCGKEDCVYCALELAVRSLDEL